MKSPKKWKLAILVWIAIYPTITLILALFGDPLKSLPLPLRTLVITAIVVPLMVLLIMPMLQKLFSRWLKS